MRIPRHSIHVKRVLYAPITLVALSVLLVLLGRAAWGAYRSERDNFTEFGRVHTEAAALRERESALESDIELLKTPRGMEEALRNKYPVVREGESMVIIVEPRAGVDEGVSEEPRGVWSRIKAIFR